MDKPSGQQAQTLNQLRMGMLGTLTAIVLCFAAAYTFSGSTSQPAEANTAPSTD